MPLFVGTRRVLRARSTTSSGVLSFVAAGAKAQAAGTLDVPYYSGLAANDIAIILAAGYNDVTFGTATGFTAETQVNHASGNRIRLYWKRLDGSESGNVSITGATGAANIGVMLGFRGAITTGTPYEGYATSNGNVASNLVTSPATTTTADGRIALRLYTHEWGAGTTPPATWTERFDGFETIISAITISADTKDVATASTEAATTRNLGGGNGTSYVCAGLALIPA